MEFLRSIDHGLFVFLNGTVGNPIFDNFFPHITDLHKIKWVVFGLFPLGLGFWFYKKRLQALKVFLSLILLIAISDSTSGKLYKPFFSRLRPPDAGVEVIKRTTRFAGYSFPSNHSVNMGASMGLLSMVYPQQKLIFAAVALLVAYSRIYVGVHFPADVIAGLLLGLFYAFVLFRLLRRWLINQPSHE